MKHLASVRRNQKHTEMVRFGATKRTFKAHRALLGILGFHDKKASYSSKNNLHKDLVCYNFVWYDQCIYYRKKHTHTPTPNIGSTHWARILSKRSTETFHVKIGARWHFSFPAHIHSVGAHHLWHRLFVEISHQQILNQGSCWNWLRDAQNLGEMCHFRNVVQGICIIWEMSSLWNWLHF